MAKECRHYWEIDNHNKGICQICEAEAEFPWDGKGSLLILKPGKPLTNRRLHKFYELRKGEILADLGNIGRKKTENKWCIPSSTLSSLLKLWRPSAETMAPLTQAIATPALIEEGSRPIKMVKRTPNQCTICEDGADSRYYLETPKGKLWLCDNCAEGVTHIFKELGIACVVTEGE